MPSYPLTAEAQRENAAALAAALGLDLGEAAKLLELTVVITVNPADTVASTLALDIAELLSRTARTVSIDTIQSIPAAELVIGDVRPRTEGRKLFLGVDDGNSTLSRVAIQPKACQPIHGLLRTIVAC